MEEKQDLFLLLIKIETLMFHSVLPVFVPKICRTGAQSVT